MAKKVFFKWQKIDFWKIKKWAATNLVNAHLYF